MNAPYKIFSKGASKSHGRQKHRIDGKEALFDVRSGMSDHDLMTKYGLSANGLQSLFKKLLNARLIEYSEIADRESLSERTVDISMFRCPACGLPQFSPFDICPQCGIIVAKYKVKQAEIKRQPKNTIEKPAAPLIYPSNGRTVRVDYRRTNFYSTRGVHRLNEIKWRFRTQGWVASSPMVHRGVVYSAATTVISMRLIQPQSRKNGCFALRVRCTVLRPCQVS